MPDLEYRKGVLLAICAYTIWGIAPLYFKLLHHVPATEILMHRVIWSFIFMVILMQFIGGFSRLRLILKQPKQLLILLITSILIAANWLIFIWAVNNDHMLDASLGYFINPLFNVLLGMVFLGERLRKLQWVAVALASIGVLVQLISFGSIPLLSLALAASFGFYGLLRKKVNIDAKSGLLVETAILLPIALGYLFITLDSSTTSMLTNTLDLNLLLVAAGIVTTIPLLCFAGSAVRIPFSILGFFQYIGPSIMFILAVKLFNEPFDIEKGITFGFIWGALVIFVGDMILQRQRRNALAKASA
ncbi:MULTISPECIES: EamA family transporter RarD [unclassified Shewanella]|jgi:chloramphenicol-sensitive protein RarD|uniref:EamA family transporter RarD n=1 Tax=unclassified Shewanella TaxID=196818 RepID=UPI000C327D21|nr:MULTISPECIES: EamA family transporter RarD [unclassified Shewanella]MBB1383054.1 EamA family transporter RarD [Shewanella sp. SR41-2]MBB1362265.1 EamA family transporter RarD [Shewanella sp. SR44-4]MBO1897973.1 EamA family transporter RarD [Shewanella sp. BF02_Schw]PKH28345.1 EamA family transporter RarD [Shewanella sp. ALD9]QHS15185.1 EamA family transporter RarD [Shewanella sp. Arc9-LZ]|tara:strand:- start:152 stop:1060 length:909 start_codon:yes stop_codon:yes gene_type:complete